MNYEVKIVKQKEFPKKLINIKKAPKVLYTIGNIELLYEDSFGIVGTRNPTEYGIQACKDFSKEFALRDIPIVSGMATGIDQISHNMALDYSGKTIGIIGCGFEYYLESKENRKIFSQIIQKNGLILSEYESNVEKCKENFPKRNRIIAALSEGILVIEAAYRSGSSITAKYAKEQEKRVYAIPGNIYNSMSVGTNNLIKKGAILSTSAQEIIESYPQFENKKRKTIRKSRKAKKMLDIKKEWKEIANSLEQETLTIEELCFKTKKDIRTLIKTLSEMEIEGIIEQEIGIGYKLKSR